MAKPEIVLHPVPATLPNGKLDCDPDPDPSGVLGEWQKEHIEKARHAINTPGDVLRRERERYEELEHARALAQIRSEARPREVPAQARRTRHSLTSAPASRWERYSAVIAQAVQESGTNNKLFCEFLDRDGVPVLPSWRVATWQEAWANPKMQSRIRSFKSDHRP
jgi:hypothetical protein